MPKAGKPFAARNTLAAARTCFGWLAREATPRRAVNPFAGIRDTTSAWSARPAARSRALAIAICSAIWPAARGRAVFRRPGAGLMLTGQRVRTWRAPGRPSSGQWLTIAAKRYKTGRPTRCGWPPTVRELIAEARRN